eukprot:1187337-Prorocentrum_minimum.AAC.5
MSIPPTEKERVWYTGVTMSQQKKIRVEDVGTFYWKTIGGGVSLIANLFSGTVPYSKADISGTDDPIVPRPCLFAKPPKPTKRYGVKE